MATDRTIELLIEELQALRVRVDQVETELHDLRTQDNETEAATTVASRDGQRTQVVEERKATSDLRRGD